MFLKDFWFLCCLVWEREKIAKGGGNVRNREISFVNVVLCLLVMWIHICSTIIAGADKGSLLFGVIYIPWRLSAFVVQGFLFLSALKFFRGMEHRPFSYPSFLWSRCKKIAFPYLCAVILSYIGLIILEYYTFDMRFLCKSFLLGDMIAPFYFVVILFQFYILMPLWRWLVQHVDFWIAAVASVLLMRLFHEGLPAMISLVSPDTTFLYNDRVFTSYLAYWVLGCYAGKQYDTFLESIQHNQYILLLGFFVFVCADALLSYGGVRGWFVVPFLEDIHTLYVCGAIVFVFWLAQKTAQVVMQWRIIQAIDGFSYELYLYHGIWLYFVQDRILPAWGIIEPKWEFLLRMILCYGLAIIVSMLVWQYRKRRKTNK